MEYVLLHEQAHLKRKDHLWKSLAFALLTVYWFNPILWVAYILFSRDIEMACDERVICEMNSEQKKVYTRTLVACSVSGGHKPVCPLAFGEVGVKRRVKSMKNYKKPSLWLTVTAAAAVLLAAVFFLRDPKEDGTKISSRTGAWEEVFADIDTYMEERILLWNRMSGGGPYANFEAHTILGTDETEEQLTVYMMVYLETYLGNQKDGTWELEFASHQPVAMTFVRTEPGNIGCSDYWIPEDGANYEPSIQEKFPEKLWDKLDTQDYIDEHQTICREKVGAFLAEREETESWNWSMNQENVQPLNFSCEVVNIGSLYYDTFRENSLNKELLSSIVVNHQPVHKIESRKELEDFREVYKKEMEFARGYEKFLPFDRVIEKYDNDFFEEKALVLVQTGGAYQDRVTVDSVESVLTGKGKQVGINLVWTENVKKGVGMSTLWLLLVEVNKADLENVAMISAVSGNKSFQEVEPVDISACISDETMLGEFISFMDIGYVDENQVILHNSQGIYVMKKQGTECVMTDSLSNEVVLTDWYCGSSWEEQDFEAEKSASRYFGKDSVNFVPFYPIERPEEGAYAYEYKYGDEYVKRELLPWQELDTFTYETVRPDEAMIEQINQALKNLNCSVQGNLALYTAAGDKIGFLLLDQDAVGTLDYLKYGEYDLGNKNVTIFPLIYKR